MRNDQLLGKLKEIVVDSIFPEICICGKWGYAICDDCKGKVKSYRTQLCPVCKKISKDGKTCKSCYEKCKLTGLFVYGKHEGLLKDLIWRYKYRFIKSLGKYFGEIMAIEFGPTLIEKEFFITNVPLSKERLNWRGYNQGQIVAEEIARRTGLKHLELLSKTGKSATQVGHNRQERIKNISGHIKIMHRISLKGRRVLVVDDVYTTGATLSECAKVLREAGASEVWGLVISRD